MTFFTPSVRETMEALANRIVPADDYPGAVQAGAVEFIEALLQTDLANMQPIFLHGIEMLNRESIAADGQDFHLLSADRQDALITNLLSKKSQDNWKVSPAQFINLVICVVSEGYYADPENGGNRDAISWKMIGFEVREGARWMPEAQTR
jgi:Gluconate 2-dehydrogenase subunit 3